jgi:UDP-glucose 4-epimerase
VTGGAGFIGSYVVERLLARGWDVVVLDDFSSGKEEKLAAVIGHKKLRIIRGSILDGRIVADALRDVDTIFHEAAVTNVQRSIDDPLTVNRVNVEGTLNLLDESRRTDVRHFIFASSCSVYGNASVLPISEDSPLAPRNPYAASKAACEHYCTAYSSTYGLSVVRLRYTNVYGARRAVGPYAGVMLNFAECLARNKPLPIFGDGTQTRDFIYSTDVAEATARSAEYQNIGGAINVGTGVATSINDLARMMSEIAGKIDLGTVRAEPRIGEIMHSQADTRLAKNILNFECRVSLREGLGEFLMWYKSLRATSGTVS